MNRNRKLIGWIVVLLAISTLACQLPFTLQPAAATQQVITVVVQPSAVPTAVPPEPTAVPPTQAPAPTASLPEAAYNGIRFNYAQPLAVNVSYETVPANPPSPDSPGWDIYPEYTLFKFNGYVLSGTFHEASIYVFPASEYAAVQPYVSDILSRLTQELANQKTTFSGNESLPFLPLWNAAQMMQSNVRYFRFANGQGVRFLSQYGQAAYPINNESLFYTYQGLTDDGQYYISAVLPVNHPALPNTMDEGVPNGDWQTFSENYPAYIDAAEPWMDTLPDDSFTPNLADLDAMMASLSVNP